MTSSANKFLASALAVAATILLATPAQAQPVYRIVGADGKVTFSDKAPPASDTQSKVSAAASGAGAGALASALPFELRQVASKYPVTLYTADNCGPCTSAKSMLITRGVPFSEKTVTTAEDSQALTRISGESTLPFATIGGQQLKGFSDSEWTQFLNAAGYPAASVLPASYRQPAAMPLVAVAVVPSASGNAAPARPAPPVQAPPAASNPAGIKF